MPKPEVIYDKEFHFLDETLSKKEERREANIPEYTNGEEPVPESVRVVEEVCEPEEPETNQMKSDEKDKLGDGEVNASMIFISNQAQHAQSVVDATKGKEPVEEYNNLANPNLKAKKGMDTGFKNHLPIQLSNQKDFLHEMVDRSLSKIRIPIKG